MKKRLALAALCLGLSILPCYSDVKEDMNEDKLRKEQIAEKDTSDVLEDSITDVVDKKITKEGVFKSFTRFLTEIPGEPLDEEPYYARTFIESIEVDLSNEFTEDPLFYDWRTGKMFDYRSGKIRTFMWRGKVLGGLGKAVVGELKTLRKKQAINEEGKLVDSKVQWVGCAVSWGDGFARKLKKITEWRPSYHDHKLTVRPEIDLEGSPGFYWEIESPSELVDGWEFRYESGDATLGKDVRLGPFRKLVLDAAYDPSSSEDEEEILGRVTYKNSFIGFDAPGKSEKDLEAERLWEERWNDKRWSERLAGYEKGRQIKVRDMNPRAIRRFQGGVKRERLAKYEKDIKTELEDMENFLHN